MKKRVILVTIALLTLMVGFAQLRGVFSLSVNRFLDERDDHERLMRFDRTGTAAEAYPSQFAPTRMINGKEMIDAFIGIDNKAVISTLRAHGVIVNCEFDDFVTAQVPVAKLTQVSNLEGVTDIEISKLMELCTDTTLSVTHAGQVINGTDYGLPQGYDGSGVIIGIIDTGFDYQHLAFRCTDDTSRTRIVRVYDPMDSTGHIATIGNNVLPGSIFMGEQIDTLTTDNRNGTHGTHTASIAAGMHVGGYGGMAPGAEIVLCSSRNLNIGISEVELVNSIKYIFSYADSVGKPCVISVSVSTYQGPHDGNDRISKAVAQTVGPGRIFVIAAGNNGSRNLYTHGKATTDKQINLLLAQDADFNADNTFFYKNLWFDTWGRAKSVRPVVRFHILDKETQHIVWQSDLISLYKKIDASEFSEYYAPDLAFDSVGYISAIISIGNSSKYEMQCYLHNLRCQQYTVNETGRLISRYAIGASIYPPSSVYPRQPDSCYIDSWMCIGYRIRNYNNSPVFIDEIDENGDTISQMIENFYNWPSDYCSIGTYAVHDSVISAGAFVGRNSYYSLPQGKVVVDNSSLIGHHYVQTSYQLEGYGPTGAALPTITAPGVMVVAAGSRYSYFGQSWHNARVMSYSGHVWGIMTGTSMAAPTVAGIIAQWLQVEPTLAPGNVKNIIAQTAIKDEWTQDPSNGFRFGPNGKIDAMAGVRYLLNLQEPEPEPLLGDVNDDGFVNVTDVTRLIAYLANTVSEDQTYVSDGLPLNPVNADFNQDGLLNITDVIRIISHVINDGDQ